MIILLSFFSGIFRVDETCCCVSALQLLKILWLVLCFAFDFMLLQFTFCSLCYYLSANVLLMLILQSGMCKLHHFLHSKRFYSQERSKSNKPVISHRKSKADMYLYENVMC